MEQFIEPAFSSPKSLAPQTPQQQPTSSLLRLWRPVAQRNLRNQWSKLSLLCHDWREASSSARSLATSLVNAYLSQKYMDGMDLGVISEMPDIRRKACLKLAKQQELYRSKLLSSYRDMVAVVIRIVETCRSMRCYKGTSASPLAQFSSSSENGDDNGDGGGVPVFTFLSIASFEELAWEIAQMFISELNLKRLLVMELLSICIERVAQVTGLSWSDEFYEGEFDNLSVCGLYSRDASEPVLPSLRNSKSCASIVKSGQQQNRDVLQVYLTTWLAEVNVDRRRMDEIFGVVGEEMRVAFS